MPKYSNKKELQKVWQEKIDSQKYYWDILKKGGQVKGSFYNSEVYRNLDRRRDRAEWRYDNRVRIAEQRRERREQDRKLESRVDEIMGTEKAAYSGPAVDAFKGGRGVADIKFAKSVMKKDRNFVGRLLVYYEETGESIDKTFHSVAGYFAALSRIVSTMFTKDNYTILESEVEKKQSFDSETNTLIFEHSIYIPEI